MANPVKRHSYRDLREYHDLIVTLVARMPNNKVYPALVERDIQTSAKAVRNYIEIVLGSRRHLPRYHRERMFGIYEKWKSDPDGESRDVVVTYNGQVRSHAFLKQSLSPRKDHNSGSNTMAVFQNYTGPTPREINYFDKNDPGTNLLELDGCPWEPAAADETGATHTNRLRDLDREESRISQPLSQAQSQNFASSDTENYARDEDNFVLADTTANTWPVFAIRCEQLVRDVDAVLQRYNPFHVTNSDVSKDLLRGSQTETMRPTMTQVDYLVDNDRLDDALELSHNALVQSTSLPQDQQLLARIVYIYVASRTDGHRQAQAYLETLTNELWAWEGVCYADILQAQYYVVETLLQAKELDEAKQRSLAILWQIHLGLTVSHDRHRAYRLQLARIYKAREDYKEALDLLLCIIQDNTTTSGPVDDIAVHACVELISLLQDFGSPAVDVYAFRPLIYLERVLGFAQSRGIPRKLWNLELVFSVGVLQCRTGAFFEAEQIFRAYALELWKRRPFSAHPKNIEAENWIAIALYYQDEFHASAAILKRLVPMAQDRFGKFHGFTFTLLSNLAWCLEHTATLDVFEEQMKEVLRMRTTHLGEHHLDTLNSRMACAYVDSVYGRWESALSTLASVGQFASKGKHSRHIETVMDSHMYRGLVLENRHAWTDAAGHFRKALTLSTRLHGGFAHCALAPLLHLADCLAETDRGEAKVLLYKSKRRLQGDLGWKHHVVLQIDLALVNLHTDDGELEEATALQEKVSEVYHSKYIDQHAYIIALMMHSAEICFRREQTTAACRFLIKAMNASFARRENDLPRILNQTSRLVRYLRCQGWYHQALDCARLGHRIATDFLGSIEADQDDNTLSSHPKYRTWLPLLESLAELYNCIGDTTASVHHWRQVMILNTAYRGYHHPSTIAVAASLVSAYDGNCEYEKADDLSRDFLGKSLSVLGEWHTLTLRHKRLRALLLAHIGLFIESQNILESIITWAFSNGCDKQQFQIASTYHYLAMVFARQDNFPAALQQLQLALDRFRYLKDDENQYMILCSMTTCYFTMGNYLEAKRTSRRLIQRFHGKSTVSKATTLDATLTFAEILLTTGDLAECQETLIPLCEDIARFHGRGTRILLEAESLRGRCLAAITSLQESGQVLNSKSIESASTL